MFTFKACALNHSLSDASETSIREMRPLRSFLGPDEYQSVNELSVDSVHDKLWADNGNCM